VFVFSRNKKFLQQNKQVQDVKIQRTSNKNKEYTDEEVRKELGRARFGMRFLACYVV
jgi:hypothetical protein